MKISKDYINLLPGKEKKRSRIALGKGTVVFLLFISAWAAAFGLEWKTLREFQDRNAMLLWKKQALAQDLASIRQELGITAASEPGGEKTALISTLLAERVAWSEVFRQFSRTAPKGLWFDSLEGNASSGAASIRIKGGAFTYLSVADFMLSLEKSGYFQTPQLMYAQKVVVQGQDVIGFEITCGIHRR